MILTNKNQKKVVRQVCERLNTLITECKKSDISGTFAPYYDIILDEKQKGLLTEVKMSSIVSDKVKNGAAMKSLQKEDLSNMASLIKYIPNKSDKSEILSDLKISNLVENFPSMMKTMDWTLVYSVNRDGVSVGTFFEKCRDWRYTLLVIKDTNGYVFGGFCCETWKQSTKFYGTGESFIYTFKNGDDITVYDWTGEND